MPDFVAGPIARKKKSEVRFLVMWTWDLVDGRVGRESKLKFSGGMEHPAERGDLQATWREEVQEETGLIIRQDAQIEYLCYVAYGEHKKHFMLAWRRDCDGSLRKRVIRDGRTVLGVPFWANKQFLEEHLYENHRIVLDRLPE